VSIRRDPERVAALRQAAKELELELMCTCGRAVVRDDGTCPACEEDDPATADGVLPEWRSYIERFPTPADALAAARSGRETSVRTGDQLRCRLRAIADDHGPGGIAETIYYLDYLDVLDTALLNARADGAPEPATIITAAIGWVTTALEEPDEWLAAASTDLEATAEQVRDRLAAVTEVVAVSGSGLDDDRPPVIGVREVVRVTGTETWAECETGAYGTLMVFNEVIQFNHAPASFAQALIDAGARLQVCFRCGEYLTNGFEEWPDTWCSMEENSSLCQPDGPASPRPPLPHIVAGAEHGA
jgi:hypothetical protein